MKQFLLFGYDSYYPCGGWNDFIASFHSEGEAITHELSLGGDYDHYDIIDTAEVDK